jgi:hypothetical protein
VAGPDDGNIKCFTTLIRIEIMIKANETPNGVIALYLALKIYKILNSFTMI